jgi:methylenetetrahydrofolate reductase (NADPH)
MSPATPRLSRTSARVRVSFEFFPPKTDEMEKSLWESIARLEPLNPNFVSVTYGAGGSTRQRTHATVERLVRETTLRPAAHLTCVGATRDQVDEVIRDYQSAGVKHIVALRGDPPGGIDAPYQALPGGYQSVDELVAGIKRIGDFEVSVGTYPEKHPQSPNILHDIEMLKRKVDAGADRAITQFFFDNSVYLRFLDVAAAAGLKIPILPGIVPVQNFKQTANFARRAGASIPAWLAEVFADIRRRHGVVPNVMRAFSIRPQVTAAVASLAGAATFGGSNLSRVQEEMIATVVSSINRCHY